MAETMVKVTIKYPDNFICVGGDKCEVKLVPNPEDPNEMIATITKVTDRFCEDVTKKRLKGIFR